MSLAERIQKSQTDSEHDAAVIRASLSLKAATSSAGPSSIVGGDEFGALANAGFRNAREQYLHNTGWVYSAVRLIAQRIAGQPIRAARKATGKRPGGMRLKAMHDSLPLQYKNMADGLEPLDGHLLLDTLADPSDLATSWSLMFVTVASLELTGRALWFATEDKGKKTILHIPTSWVTKVSVYGQPWEIQPDGRSTPVKIPADEIVHFFYPDPSSPLGALSPLQQLARAVTADEAIEDSQLAAHRQGIRPGVIIKAGRMKNTSAGGGAEGLRPVLTPEQRSQLVTAIRGAYQGVHRRGEPAIVDGLVEDIIPFTRTPEEMDFLGSSKLTKERILQGFGVNPILLGAIEGANRASAAAADEIFVANKVNPIIEQVSLAMTEWLGPIFAAKNEKLVVWIERAAAKDEDLKLRQWTAGLTRNVVTPNEYRRHVLNLPDIEGGDELPDAAPATAAGIAAAEKWYRSRDPYTGKPLEG